MANILESKKKTGGFTLIELLVVISIIAILASILFPVFSRVRESARRVSCLSNQKQIGLGLMQYVQDYDSRYPPQAMLMTNTYYSKATPGPYWLLNPYIKSKAVWICPSDYANELDEVCATGLCYYGSASSDRKVSPATVTNANTGRSYIWNKIFAKYYAKNKRGETIGITENSYEYPAEMWIMADGVGYLTSIDGNGAYAIPARHFGGANVIYADGHAKWKAGPIKFKGGVYTKSRQAWDFTKAWGGNGIDNRVSGRFWYGRD